MRQYSGQHAEGRGGTGLTEAVRFLLIKRRYTSQQPDHQSLWQAEVGVSVGSKVRTRQPTWCAIRGAAQVQDCGSTYRCTCGSTSLVGHLGLLAEAWGCMRGSHEGVVHQVVSPSAWLVVVAGSWDGMCPVQLYRIAMHACIGWFELTGAQQARSHGCQ